MDAIDIEALSFTQQQIIRRILYEVNRQGLQLLSLGVINAMVQYFHQGVPVWNHSLHHHHKARTEHPSCSILR